MRIVRHHVDTALVVGQQLALPEAAVAHLVRVLRLGAGDEVVLFNGDGFDYLARLVSVTKKTADAQVTEKLAAAAESPLRITLAQGIARGEKMDLILQKATELGVARIAPVLTERTEVKLDGERAEKKMQHWRGVLAAACEQSGRARLPELIAPQALDRFAAQERSTRRFLLDPSAGSSLAGVMTLVVHITPRAVRPVGVTGVNSAPVSLLMTVAGTINDPIGVSFSTAPVIPNTTTRAMSGTALNNASVDWVARSVPMPV